MTFFREFDNEDTFNYYIQLGFLSSDIFIFITLFFIDAYYGRFFNSFSLLPSIPCHLSWIIQECPCVFISLFFILTKFHSISLMNVLVLLPFLLHYIHRSFVFPFKLKTTKKTPLELTFLAFIFCSFNATMINRSILLYSQYEEISLQMIVGISIMMIGALINIFHDYYVIGLRKQTTAYILPKGYLYEYISCPNYFGEMVEWFGFWVLSGTFSAFVFAVSTVANLFPRAIKTHQWYHKKFNEYPKQRKAVIPFII